MDDKRPPSSPPPQNPILRGIQELSRSGLFWTLVLVLFLRAFVVEPFRIPSGSMVPTLLEGDFLFVAKGSYDIGIPFTNIKLIEVSNPKNGDVVVFEYPNNEMDESKDGLYYIKRIVGIPGDKISLRAGILEINGQVIEQASYPKGGPAPGEIPEFAVANGDDVLLEALPGMKRPHFVQRDRKFAQEIPAYIRQYQEQYKENCFDLAASLTLSSPLFKPVAMNEICEFTVPPGRYFVMGDNRENSADGREWGYVDRELLKGRALFVWMSLRQGPYMPVDGERALLGGVFRWSRFGLGIN